MPLSSLVILLLFYINVPTVWRKSLPLPSTGLRLEAAPEAEKPKWKPRRSCLGPRGKLLDDEFAEDLPHPVRKLHSDVTFPEPTTGSYETLGLDQSWLTFDERYGPYGYGEESPEYRFSKANWELDWGKLQNDCLATNDLPAQGTVSRLTAKP